MCVVLCVCVCVRWCVYGVWLTWFPLADEYTHLVQVAGSGLNATVDNVFDTLTNFNALWSKANREIMDLAASPAQKQALILLSVA